jgi:hypothetical protein
MWYRLYCNVITQAFRDELVGISIAAIPPNRQLGNIKLRINLFNFSLLANTTIDTNIIWIEHKWNGRSVLGRTPPYLSSLAII